MARRGTRTQRETRHGNSVWKISENQTRRSGTRSPNRTEPNRTGGGDERLTWLCAASPRLRRPSCVLRRNFRNPDRARVGPPGPGSGPRSEPPAPEEDSVSRTDPRAGFGIQNGDGSSADHRYLPRRRGALDERREQMRDAAARTVIWRLVAPESPFFSLSGGARSRTEGVSAPNLHKQRLQSACSPGRRGSGVPAHSRTPAGPSTGPEPESGVSRACSDGNLPEPPRTSRQLSFGISRL